MMGKRRLLRIGRIGVFIVAAMLGNIVSGSVSAEERTISLEVERMTCPACPLIVRKALGRVDGVKSVEVLFEKKIAVVTFDDEKTGNEVLVAASTNAGYPATVK